MLKNIIAPVQAWLLSRGQCVGCGTPLSKGQAKKRNDNMTQVTCACGRVFVRNAGAQTYRRALLSEIE